MQQRLALEADLVVLSAAVVPSAGSNEAAALFKVSKNPDGFFQEAHVKLRPVDAGADGVFLCGTAHYPKHLSETISSAYGAAGRAASLLSQDTVTASGQEQQEVKRTQLGVRRHGCSFAPRQHRGNPRQPRRRWPAGA